MSVLKKRRALLTNLDEENSKIQKIVQSKKASAPGGGEIPYGTDGDARRKF